MSGRRPRDHHCTRCGRTCVAKRLTVINGTESICTKCLDAIPPGIRRTLLRKEATR